MGFLLGTVIGALIGYYFRDTVGDLIEKAKAFYITKTADSNGSEETASKKK